MSNGEWSRQYLCRLLITPCGPMSLDVSFVVVTGFLGTQLTKSLLERGYNVRGTARDASLEPMEHLKTLAAALPGSLQLVSLDLQRLSACEKVVAGAQYVFHIAGPNFLTTGDPAQDKDVIFKPAIAGTRNIVQAAANAKVRRLVCTSSITTAVNPFSTAVDPANEDSWNPDLMMDFSYIHAKYASEKEAASFAAELGLDLVTLLPSRVIGPTVSRRLGTSVSLIKTLLEGGGWEDCAIPLYIDVHDYALANIRAAELPHAKGRYNISHPTAFTVRQLHSVLQEAFPQVDLVPVPEQLQHLQEANPGVDTTKLQRDLGIYPVQPKTSVLDQARSLLALGMVNPKLRQA